MPPTAIAGVGLLVLAGLYWMASDQIAQSAMSGSVGADGLPKLLAAVLAFLSLLLIAQSLVLRRSLASPEDPDTEDGEPDTPRRGYILAGALLAIALAYVVVLPYLGYAVSVTLLLFAVAAFYGRKPTPGLFAFAVIGGGVLYLIFVQLLGGRMPAGIWPELFGLAPSAG